MIAAPVLGGCAEKAQYRPYPNMQGQLPNSPGAVINQTTQAMSGALVCLQTPPDITVSTANAARSCLLGGDLPAEANCGGYQFQAVCHNPTFNNGVACMGVQSVTCNDVTVIGQRGPTKISTGRTPVRVTIPAGSPSTPNAPQELPQYGGLTIPGLPQNFPGAPHMPFPINN